MRQMLREVKFEIVRRGGRAIEIEERGSHTRVLFFNPAGSREHVDIHKGANGKRYEQALRSQLRRKGLQEPAR